MLIACVAELSIRRLDLAGFEPGGATDCFIEDCHPVDEIPVDEFRFRRLQDGHLHEFEI